MESFFLNHQEHQDYCAIENSIGAIVDDNLLIYQDEILLSFKLGHLAKVSFHKTRNYFLNFVFFVLAFISICGILYRETTFLEYLILLVICTCASILGYKIKSMYYTFLILRFNLSFTKIKVKSNQVKDADELLANINDELRARSGAFMDRTLSNFMKKYKE